jgi:hypothetical protein
MARMLLVISFVVSFLSSAISHGQCTNFFEATALSACGISGTSLQSHCDDSSNPGTSSSEAGHICGCINVYLFNTNWAPIFGIFFNKSISATTVDWSPSSRADGIFRPPIS